MLHYKSSVYKKGYRDNEDLPTATKTQTYLTPYSPQSKYGDEVISSFKYTSPRYSKNMYRSRVNDVQKQIGQLVTGVQRKRAMNDEGVRKVRDTNIQARDYYLDQYHHESSGNSSTPKLGHLHQANNFRKRNYTDTGDDYQAHLSPTTSQKFYDLAYQHQAQADQLRKALSYQSKLNDNLSKHIKKLQEENHYIQMNRNAHKKPLTTSIACNGRVPTYILQQLDALKRQNDNLRRETTRLLADKQYKYRV